MLNKKQNNSPYYVGAIICSIIIGGIVWQLRDILPWSDVGFWIAGILSLVIPFGLWFIFEKYYNWSKDNDQQTKQEIRLAEESREICKKYAAMPFLTNGSES